MQRLLAVACFFGIVGGMLGPLYDHCFVERYPFHVHLGAGSAAWHVEHYQLFHQDPGGQPKGLQSDDTGPIAVKDFHAASNDASGTALVLVMSRNIEPVVPDMASPRVSESVFVLSGIDVSLPDKPPRASL